MLLRNRSLTGKTGKLAPVYRGRLALRPHSVIAPGAEASSLESHAAVFACQVSLASFNLEVSLSSGDFHDTFEGQFMSVNLSLAVCLHDSVQVGRRWQGSHGRGAVFFPSRPTRLTHILMNQEIPLMTMCTLII